jgi:hypothetical protein
MPDDELLSVMDESGISFVGTVQRTHESTVAGVPVDDHTAVVRVSQVLHAPRALQGITGMEVTVELGENAPTMAPGEQAAFFTDPVTFQKGIAVREVARRRVEDVQGALTEATLAPGSVPSVFARQLNERRVRDHAAQADAIITGTVVGLEQVGPLPMSEHAPDYWRATVSVSHVERGNVTGDQAQVLYDNSLDVHRRTSPKPKAGQEGLWLLHVTEGQQRDLAPWIIPHPEDFQPVEHLELLRGEGGAS